MCLVSVYGTGPFWGRSRFGRVGVDEVLEGKVGAYVPRGRE